MRGTDRFLELFDKYRGRPVLLYGDPDVDGLVSLRFMCEFCGMVGIKGYYYHVNNNRQHGFELDAGSLAGYLVIAADFYIPRETMQGLVDADVAVLSTDHHECEADFVDVVGKAAGIVVNNQYPFEPEEDRYLSGAGVFYEFICAMFPGFASKEREALVGVTLLSDVRQIENPKARRYLKAAYTADVSKGYLGYLVSSCLGTDFAFGAPKLDRNFIDYYLSPTVNALLRLGMLEDAIRFILGEGLVNTDARERQAALVSEMEGKAEVLGFPDLHYIAVDANVFSVGELVTNFIGLLCSRHKDAHGNVTTLGMVVKDGVVLRASVRGKYDDVPYQAEFRKHGVRAEGHSNAFGLPDFLPTEELYGQLDGLVHGLELGHISTVTVVESVNLAATLLMNGEKYAEENCYVRDMYRTYIRYVGKGAKLIRVTYKSKEFDPEDYLKGVSPDMVSRGVSYKYVRDVMGNPIPKYMEYQVDGRKVKSFGVSIEDGVILPIKEKGYLQLYIRGAVT